MENAHYALLMLDNMPLQGYFVIAKTVGYLDADNLEEQIDYTIYEDLITKNRIYPSSFEANEFLNSEEYERELKELKWISRKKISKKEALSMVKSLNKENLLSYSINICSSKEKKSKEYKANLLKHRETVKKINKRR